jgi:hypothetical protein
MERQATPPRTVGWRAARRGPPVALLALLACPPAAAEAAPVLTRGPFLQTLGTDRATVVWRLDAAASCGVEIGPLGGAAHVVGGGAGSECAVRVNGLAPGATYRYVPLADGVPVAPAAAFRTDHPELPYTFLVFGDSGNGSAQQMQVRDALLASPADFILHTGDMIYPSALPEEWDPKFFVPYRALLRRLVLWPCLGNHDVNADDGASWREAFVTPANNQAGREDYYSFDYGNAHVVVLDSNTSLRPGSAQHAFLAADLAASTARWTFVAFHHSIYSSGEHASNLSIRERILPLLDGHDVDIVFMGHDHDYERTHPLRADQISAPGEGTVYVTTGGGGAKLRPVVASGFTAYAESALHFVRVQVAGGALALEMVRADGTIADTFAFTKDAEPACGDGRVNRIGERCDGADAAACPGRCTESCTCPPVCGDGVRQPGAEECDWPEDAACPGLCVADCTCAEAPVVLELEPVADTYIEAGAGATVERGKVGSLNVDAEPWRVAYLTFDVPRISQPLETAIVTLYVTDASPDGGALYPVADSGWREGTDPASGTPGLRWIDVDTNRNGVLDPTDTSPFLPDFSHPIAVVGPVQVKTFRALDVTGALRDGFGPRTFALRTSHTNGATYRSRESPAAEQRPRLTLRFALECWSHADCDDGVFCNGPETCTRGGCRPAAGPPVCDDGTGCTVGACDAGADGCRFDPVLDGTPCDDGDACTAGDACAGGRCVAGAKSPCPAPNDCQESVTCDPATGACEHRDRPDGTPCDDGDQCTRADACRAGACVGTDPVACPPPAACETAGACDPATGACVREPLPDGTLCDDGDACTRLDVCTGGGCVGTMPVACPPPGPCHAAACDPATGTCSTEPSPDGTACDDGNGCTRVDACRDGTCVGTDPVVCTAADQCHQAGVCNPFIGRCSHPARPDGAACEDASFCTVDDVCRGGVCTGRQRVCAAGGDPCRVGACDERRDACVVVARPDGTPCDDGVFCTVGDACARGTCAGAPRDCESGEPCRGGSCEEEAGVCSLAPDPDGTPCDDGDRCTEADRCTAGVCRGDPLADTDADGVCDAIDVCPLIADPAQGDADLDGTGDVCQCTEAAPGQCIAGGGSTRTDCWLEFMTAGRVTPSREGTRVKSVVRCRDGETGCDRDGARDGRCSFDVALCFGNADPRYPACHPSRVHSVEVVRRRRAPADLLAGAERLEGALGDLGVGVMRGGRVVAAAARPAGDNLCTASVRLETPAPTGRRPVRRKFTLGAWTASGRHDRDRFVLVCEP